MPTVDENPIVDIAPVPEGKRCLRCGEWITHMEFSCSYREWGTASGTVNMDGDEDVCDSSCDDSEHNEYEYYCPECNGNLDYDFFDSDEEYDENGEDEEIEPSKPSPVIVDQGRNSEQSAREQSYICPNCEHEFRDLVIPSPVTRDVPCPECGHEFPSGENLINNA